MTPDDFSYEEALKEVRTIIQKMEQGAIALDDLAATVAHVNGLLEKCQTKLRAIEAQIDEKSDGSTDESHE